MFGFIKLEFLLQLVRGSKECWTERKDGVLSIDEPKIKNGG